MSSSIKRGCSIIQIERDLQDVKLKVKKSKGSR